MNVPKEIYTNIFQHLCKTQIWKCIMVCKEWSLPALQIYYHEMSFTGYNTHCLISALDQGEQHYFQLCHWVETLNISQEGYENFSEISSSDNEEAKETKSLTKEQLLKFLSYLPNLKKLSLSMEYVKYLVDLNTDRYLTRLEEISPKVDPSDNTYDFSNIYYKFRTSLKKLTIVQEPAKPNMITQYGGILNYLNQFKSLTHLTYENQPEQAVTVYQLQVACPNLTTLKFSISEQMVEYQEENNNAFLNTSNLQSLVLSFPKMSASYTDMLIHHLPTKLNKLYVQLESIDLYDWINLIGLERVLKLAERMSKLSSAEIRCEPYGYYHIESEHDDVVSEMTLFFQVLNAFKGEKKVFCKAQFSDFASIHKSMSYSNGVLDVFYGLKHRDMYGHNQELALPDKMISIIGPEIFNQLKFYLCVIDNQLTYKVLKYSLTNCNYLQHVEFVEVNSPRHEFYLCNSIDRQYNYYTHNRLQLSTKTEENLKVVKLKNFVPSHDFLHMLATYLPNVYYFKCGGKKAKFVLI